MAGSLVIALPIASLYFVLTWALSLVAWGVGDFDDGGRWCVKSLAIAAALGGVMLVLVPIDLASQQHENPAQVPDLLFFPRFYKIGEWWRNTAARWTVLVGLLLLAFFIAGSLLKERRPGIVSPGFEIPAEWIFLGGLLAWGVLWIGDVLCRPRNTTLMAAIGYFVFVLFLLVPFLTKGLGAAI